MRRYALLATEEENKLHLLQTKKDNKHAYNQTSIKKKHAYNQTSIKLITSFRVLLRIYINSSISPPPPQRINSMVWSLKFMFLESSLY